MKVVVDLGLCEGHALCMVAAPTVFDVDDFVNLLQDDPPESLRASIEEAVRTCPTCAISIEN